MNNDFRTKHDSNLLDKYSLIESKKLHEFITIERIKKGISTFDISRIADISETDYIKFELGEYPINKDVLTNILIFLKLPMKLKKLAYDNDKSLFANRLNELRTLYNTNISLLCIELDLNPKTYSHYESGRSEPSIKNLIKIADYYNISLDYLTGRTNLKTDFK